MTLIGKRRVGTILIKEIDAEAVLKDGAESYKKFRDNQKVIDAEAVLKGDAERKKRSRDNLKEIDAEAVLKDGAQRYKKFRDTQKVIDAEAVLKGDASRKKKRRDHLKSIDAEARKMKLSVREGVSVGRKKLMWMACISLGLKGRKSTEGSRERHS